MSAGYKAVQWNKHKKVYDTVLLVGVVLYLIGFVVVGKLVWHGQQGMSDEILLIRALGSCAILLLHVILCIGPLTRLSTVFNPLLYNRRHMGVTMFLVGLAHAVLATAWYHGFGDVNPLVSIFVSNTRYDSLAGFPFEVLGAGALVILFLMAATSHDFWLANLSPPLWKSIHMLVYVAYGLLVMHVVLGVLQTERSVLYPALLGVGAATVAALHIVAGCCQWRLDAEGLSIQAGQEWVDVGPVDSILADRAKVVVLQGCERVAVFRYGNKISAVSNVCAHQNGPLGEGKVVDGCVTCPWHGYQYHPHNGQSPPPYTEKIPTYRVRIDDKRVLLDPRSLSPGTPVEPAVVGEGP